MGGDCREAPCMPQLPLQAPTPCPKAPASPHSFQSSCSAVRQGLHWGKRWPYLALSPHRSQELKAVFGQATAAQPQWPQCRLCPLCPLHASPLTCHKEALFFPKKVYLRFGFVFPRRCVFLMPFPSILISSDFLHSGHKL